MNDIDTLIGRHAMLHAVGSAVLAHAEGAAPAALAERAAREWRRADPELKRNTITTLIRCLSWAAHAASTPAGQETEPVRESVLLRALDGLPPFTPRAAQMLALAASAPDTDAAFRQAVALVESGTMDAVQQFEAAFEATVTLIRVAADTHADAGLGGLCVLLGQMTVSVT
ncbi:hypothetical protein [Amycolatopsis rubida]|uniref:Uncharacterized protein n=1 Tax=Amycolatopsis rubida TaxID=112413 RepID=A0A1I5X5Z0_9PSEU|nr:hypothetical protein [Amycolatopsis rubida]SFQ27392.1 hypothetical protein SAMN05421854_11051 [Amycolatopsis rubida]